MSGKLMRISGVDVSRARGFIFDGCHKIYLLRKKAEVERWRADGYDIHPMKELERTFANSCPLRFINWAGTLETVVPQFAQRVTFTYSSRKSLVRFRPFGKGGRRQSTQ